MSAWSATSYHRVGRLALAILVVVMSSVVVALATGLIGTPRGTPFAPNSSSALNQVLVAATTWTGPADDPPITLPSGLQVKSSSYDGVQVGDATYYYNLAPRASYDPLGRGEVSAGQIQVVAIVGDAPNRVMVYTVTSDSPFGRMASNGSSRH